MTGRRQREFAPLPPGIVRVRLQGESAPALAALLPTLPGVAIVTGPDAYEGDRLYLTVAILGGDQARALPAVTT
ncbi:MAG TPA: hypothetical protein VK586_02865 [Streptosporangiaceae bacterium]|nr:hypothetical protein [Streptosporangiaceae bacterium]